MARRYKRISRIIFLTLNSLISAAFLLACLAPHLDPKKWWFISLLGLAFAFIIVSMVAFVLFWLVFKPIYALISIIPLIIGYKSIFVFFAFHIPEKFDYNKSSESLRVVHWNVARFMEWKRNNNKGSKTRLKMMDLIKEQNADVLCLQEFFTSTDTIYYNNLNHMMRELGYPYYYFSWDGDGDRQWVGQAIFSRLPIVDSGMVRYKKPAMPESLLHADILFKGDTIRFYTTHLQSVQFKKQDFETIEKLKKTEEVKMEQSKNIFVKLKRSAQRRSLQADMVRTEIDSSPHPYVLTGDFNDVPNSYTYFTIRGDDLQDAFLLTGMGVGKTFSYIAPTLRIDYILATPEIRIHQFNRILREYSDHYMLVADLQPVGKRRARDSR